MIGLGWSLIAAGFAISQIASFGATLKWRRTGRFVALGILSAIAGAVLLLREAAHGGGKAFGIAVLVGLVAVPAIVVLWILVDGSLGEWGKNLHFRRHRHELEGIVRDRATLLAKSERRRLGILRIELFGERTFLMMGESDDNGRTPASWSGLLFSPGAPFEVGENLDARRRVSRVKPIDGGWSWLGISEIQ